MICCPYRALVTVEEHSDASQRQLPFFLEITDKRFENGGATVLKDRRRNGLFTTKNERELGFYRLSYSL